MEPKLPAPNPSPEMGGYEQKAPLAPIEVAPAVPETQPERGSSPEVAAKGPADNGPALPMPHIPALPAQQIGSSLLSALPVQPGDTPVSANDDEVIEKEWVDKAKKIVLQTKDDPYTQEKEVSKLQADYLKKRYGKEVKLTSD